MVIFIIKSSISRGRKNDGEKGARATVGIGREKGAEHEEQ
jgi:hypothetical protein